MEIPAPVAAAPIETAARGRRASDEPNPFLDEGWLWAQYEAVAAALAAKEDPSGLTQSVTVPGGWETRQMANKQRELLFDAETGEPLMHEVLIGDAATVSAMIRKAAAVLDIGVSVRAVPAVNERGKPVKGMVEVKYLTKERKQKKDK